MPLVMTALLLAQAAPPDLPVAVVVEYVDGRRISTILGARPHRSWTPLFPRIAGWRPPDGGERVAAIEYEFVREDDAVRANISVLFGSPHQREAKVVEVIVGRGEAIRVDGLERFGVRPVTLSLAPVGPLAMYPPIVENRTTGLEVTSVDLVTDAPPRYRITIRNRTEKAAIAVGYASWRSGSLALSGRQGDRFGSPIVAPGGAFTFDFANSGGRSAADLPVSPEPFDKIAITSVLWDDGSFEGDAKPARDQLLLEAGRRAALPRIIALIYAARTAAADAPDATAASLVDAIAALPLDATDAVVKAGMQHAKDFAADHIRRIEAARLPDQSFRRALDEAHALYSAWLGRLAARAAISLP